MTEDEYKEKQRMLNAINWTINKRGLASAPVDFIIKKRLLEEDLFREDCHRFLDAGREGLAYD